MHYLSINDLSFIGIIFTFISTIFFGKGVIQATLTDVVKANRNVWGENFDKIKNVIAITIDGRFGLVFLIIGFPLQCFSLFYDVQLRNANHVFDFKLGLIIVIISIISNLIYTRVKSKQLIMLIYKNYLIDQIKYIKNPSTGYSFETITNQLDNYLGKAIYMKRHKNETNEEYSLRLTEMLSKGDK